MPLKKPKPTDCDLCLKRIVEGKEEALQCEGGCSLWFHRYCAGVSVSHFKELSNSPEPFICYACHQRSQLAVTKQLQSEVAHLKGEILKLSEKLAKLVTTTPSPLPLAGASVSQLSNSNSNHCCTNSYGHSYADALKQAGNSANSPISSANMQAQTATNRAPRANAKRNSTVNKKFNTVIHGLRECPKGSPKHERMSHDTNLASMTIKSICPDLSEYAICDCSRIGKYSEHKTRPLLVKFARSCDVAAVLSSRHKISKAECPNVSIKPFMTISERKTESTLLKERRALIDSGVERKHIRIRGNSMYVNGTKVGSANENIFTRHQIEDQPLISNPPTNNSSTSNVMSTNVASNAASNMSTNFTNDAISNSQELQHSHVGSPSSSPLSTNPE